MKCPYCGEENTKVIDSRPSEENNAIRRRRQCEKCKKRFTTYEKVETICKKVGLFVVPVGEMECFDKTVNKEKKDWVYHILENYDLAVEPKLTEARAFVQSVVEFKLSEDMQ